MKPKAKYQRMYEKCKSLKKGQTCRVLSLREMPRGTAGATKTSMLPAMNNDHLF